jgi:DNA-binding NarL/FixJ family response regulator
MRILLVEPQALVRAGLRQVALALDPASKFLEATNVDSACAVAAQSARGHDVLDAVLVDGTTIRSRDVHRLRHCAPGSVLVVIAASGDARMLRCFMSAGANAVVPRDAPAEVHTAALRVAQFGGACVQNRALDLRRPARPRSAAERALHFHPTRRQADVLCLLAQDLTNKAIADALGIGVRTVKGHMTVLLRALGARGRADAVAQARRAVATAAFDAPASDASDPGTVPAARIR